MKDYWKELAKTETFNEIEQADTIIKSVCCSMVATFLVVIPLLLGVGIGLNWMMPIKAILFILSFIESALISGLLWGRIKCNGPK